MSDRSCSASRRAATRPGSASCAERQLLANVIASSMDEHARYGGVVPEIAARAHLEALTPTLNAALAEADVTLADLDAIAVTSGPGLSGALMVGVGAAKALAVSLDNPALRRQPPRRPRRRRRAQTDATRSSIPPSRSSSRAGTPRCCSSATSSAMSSCSARPSTMRLARRSTRSHACSGCRTRAVPRSTGRSIRRPEGHPVPARAEPAEGPREAPLRLLVLGAQDRRRTLGRAAARRR
jgi:hypothetical protein